MSGEITVETASKALQSAGYRMTPQRMMILDMLIQAEDHVSAEGLHERIRKIYPQLSFSTVYRTLETLRDMGLVTQTDLGVGRWQYHTVDKANHHHIICQQCGKVTTVTEDVFAGARDYLKQKYGFNANMYHYAIYGSCPECS